MRPRDIEALGRAAAVPTLDDLARVERELRDIDYTRQHADTIAAYVEAQMAWLRQPSHYAYRYPDGYIRFSGGARVNGQDPIESIALYVAPPTAPSGTKENGDG